MPHRRICIVSQIAKLRNRSNRIARMRSLHPPLAPVVYLSVMQADNAVKREGETDATESQQQGITARGNAAS